MATEQRFETGALRSVKPDILCLDGHQFHINYDIPQDVTDELMELFFRTPEITYEEIPNHLKAYEVGLVNLLRLISARLIKIKVHQGVNESKG